MTTAAGLYAECSAVSVLTVGMLHERASIHSPVVVLGRRQVTAEAMYCSDRYDDDDDDAPLSAPLSQYTPVCRLRRRRGQLALCPVKKIHLTALSAYR